MPGEDLAYALHMISGLKPNYAINPTPELYLRSNRAILPARVIAALGLSMRIPVLLLVFAFGSHCDVAQACRVTARDPLSSVNDLSELSTYQSIYVGKVVSLVLSSSIDQLRKRSELEVVELVGGTLPFEYGVFPEEVLKGSASEPQVAVAGGCAVFHPTMLDRVIVFRKEDGTSHFRVLRDGGAEYVMRVRKCLTGSC